MKYLADLGLKQAVMPPQLRPDLSTLRRLGFSGSDSQVIEKAAREDGRLLAAVFSASSMWAANAATVSPSADCSDGRVHFTPANLITQFHRSLEPKATAAILRQIFADQSFFAHHDPLPAHPHYSDEGAANHTQLSISHSLPGIELFVYGKEGRNDSIPGKFPARQTHEACDAIARLHNLNSSAAIFARQNPRAIDAGAFHNDVIAVGNENVLLYHELAYADSRSVMRGLSESFTARTETPLYLIEVADKQVSLKDAVETYLFNSQLVTLPDGSMSLIAPIECRERPKVEQCIQQLVATDNPIRSVHYLDVRQSMNNGGGPACLRLRVVLSELELSRVHQGILLTDSLYGKLIASVEKHYREELKPQDLADPKLAAECRTAVEELHTLLGLNIASAPGNL